jgi:hypothetical protein
MAWPFSNESKPPETELKPPSETKPPAEKTQAEQVADSIAAALGPMTESLRTISERQRQLEEKLTPKPKAAESAQPTSVLEDEDAAFGQRLGPVVLRQLELEARIVRDQIEREYEKAGFGDIWNQYRSDIEKTLNGSQLYTPDGQGGVKALRGDPEYVRNVVDMIFGRAARQAGMRFDGKDKKFFLENAGGDAGPGSHNKPADDGLSADQRKVFQRMGVPLDKAKETLGKLRFVS